MTIKELDPALGPGGEVLKVGKERVVRWQEQEDYLDAYVAKVTGPDTVVVTHYTNRVVFGDESFEVVERSAIPKHPLLRGKLDWIP